VTEHKVRIAEWAVAAAPDRIVTIGLGSCVAIVLWDERARVGGMAHVLLPASGGAQEVRYPGKFPATAVPLLLGEMRARGASTAPGGVTARLVGGASLFAGLLTPDGAGNIGVRNVQASRDVLKSLKVRVVGELVGGDCGRSVYFDVGSGKLSVRSMRGGDREL
jgi:chemotaxis protein CheD